MSTAFIVPMCPQCGSPLPELPTSDHPITCEFCSGKVYGHESPQPQQLQEDYSRTYQEVLRIKQEYPKVETIGADIKKIRIPISSMGKEFDVLLVLDDYPQNVFIDYPRGLRNIIGPPNYLTTITSWKPNGSHAVDVLKEITSMLSTKRSSTISPETVKEDLSNLEKSYQVERISEIETRIYVYTSRTRFHITVHQTTQTPTASVPANIKRVLSTANELEHRYNEGQITLQDLVSRLEYAANVQDRIITEIHKIRNNFVDVQFYPQTRQISLTVPVDPIKLQFNISLSEKFPIIHPQITMLTRLKNKKLENAILQRLRYALDSWTPYSSLTDLLTEIQGVVATFLYGKY